MSDINPNALKKLRVSQNMTLDRLARESGVSKGTINKIERGRRTEIRDFTAQRLARALKVSLEVLQGKPSPNDQSLNKLNLSSLNKSELSLTLDDGCRNALQLVAWRYRLPLDEIVNLTPFLFLWAAEKSLRIRNDAIAQIDAKYDEIVAIRKASLPHISFRIGQNMISEEVGYIEAESIDKRDLFGRIVEEKSDDLAIAIRDDYDESEHNPFTGFLKTLAAELPGQAQFDWMWSTGSPKYEICRDVAMKLVGDDEEAAEVILSGRAPLHLLPDDLRGTGKAPGRAEWAKAEALKRPALNLDDIF